MGGRRGGERECGEGDSTSTAKLRADLTSHRKYVSFPHKINVAGARKGFKEEEEKETVGERKRGYSRSTRIPRAGAKEHCTICDLSTSRLAAACQ